MGIKLSQDFLTEKSYWDKKKKKKKDKAKTKQSKTSTKTTKSLEDQYVAVLKSSNEELKQATYLVLEPDSVDLHGDTYSADEVRKACHSFNKFCNVANILHLKETTSFEVIESYILPEDISVNDTEIKKGSWLSVLQFVDDDVWQGVKNGEYTGVSIGAYASVEEIKDE